MTVLRSLALQSIHLEVGWSWRSHVYGLELEQRSSGHRGGTPVGNTQMLPYEIGTGLEKLQVKEANKAQCHLVVTAEVG
jgi:hypothetical protein